MFSSTRSVRTISLTLAIVSAPALAGQFDYTLYGGMEHSDNIGLSATAPVSQWVLIPGLGFSYLEQGATLQASATGAAEYRDYLGGPYANQKFGELAGVANWSMLPGRLDFAAQDYASVQPVSTLSSNAPGNQQQTNVLALGPTLHFELGGALHGQAELRYIDSRASRTAEFDSSRGEAALRLTRDISPISQLSLNLESQKVDFDKDSMADYRRDEVFAQYVRRLPNIDLDAALGWSRIHFDGANGNASDPLLRAKLDWHATSRSTFGAAYMRSYSDAALDLIDLAGPMESNARPVAPGGIQTGGTVIGGGVYLERRVDGRYSYNGDNFTVRLSPWYSKLRYLDGTQPDQTARGGDAGLDYRVNPRLTLTTFADIARVKYRTLARQDTTRNIGAGLIGQVSQHWSWRATLSNHHRDSNVTGQSYRETQVYFGVSYRR